MNTTIDLVKNTILFKYAMGSTFSQEMGIILIKKYILVRWGVNLPGNQGVKIIVLNSKHLELTTNLNF